ncbi:MAG TPA: sensor histidine kinase KdpD, partial [Spirochaetota bacterium]|nr:sensor histidine kinase KdpD [Spirochaetota bacterium]
MAGDYSRPDPDELLRSIKEQEQANSARGRLKIFFGMAAGVGKTYAMLGAAHMSARDGVDVVIGYIETHGRIETEELVKGLEAVPRKRMDYHGISVEEFDIDAVLVRRPAIVLVDELAHTNAAGSRHPKRYQDVLELIDNGIDVFTTLNVQHLESLADVVEKITDVKVRETIPDSVLDLADEIELVDIPPEELLKRLSEGKVYVPEKAGLAAERFFKKGNITALREMALHYTARLVGYELRDYAQKKNITGPWKSGERLLVAVSPSPYSEYLIRWTRRIAFNLNAPWIALYVERQKKLSEKSQILLSKNLALARELGAEVISTADEDIVNGLLRVTHQKNITQIVVGKPLRRYLADYFSGGNLVERLLKASGDIEIHVVTQPDLPRPEAVKKGPAPRTAFAENIREYFIGCGYVAAVTILNLLMVSFTGRWTIALVYLLSIVMLSLFIGRWPVFMAAALSAIAWNFLFIPPLYTFRIGSVEDAVMFGMYFVIALIMGGLTTKLRLKEWALRIREKRITELYEFSKDLGDALGMEQVVASARRFLEKYFNAGAMVLLADDSGILMPYPAEEDTATISDKERAIAEWVFKNKQQAGLFTKTLPNAEAIYLPLIAPGRVVGVLALRPASGNGLTFEQESFLQNITYQLSMRIERENLSAMTQKALLANESERLYRVILNSVTHEIRTPLTAIKGSISTVLDPAVGENEQSRTHLLHETQEATERMIRLVDSLLDMSRIESGKLSLNLDWNDISDIINTTLNRLEPHLKNNIISVDCPEEIPLVLVDYSLMAQALYCLVHNAIVHTRPGTPVRIAVEKAGEGIVIMVEDEGP